MEFTKYELEGLKILAENCAFAKKGERALILFDQWTTDIASGLKDVLQELGVLVKCELIENQFIHGQEPSERIRQKMLAVEIIFCFTKFSLAHTEARRSATENSARFMSLPMYNRKILQSRALRADFKLLANDGFRVAEMLNKGEKVEITSSDGTNLKFSISERRANTAPGFCHLPGELASPPDSETNIAIVEDSTEGIFLVNGSIPHPEIGLIHEPITLYFHEGKIYKIEGNHLAKRLENIFEKAGSENARIAGEFGVGLNPFASLSGDMLEDEGVRGTVHIGVGSNATIGGLNKINFHLDHVTSRVDVKIDKIFLMKQGNLFLEEPQ
ncbi:MAG: hypothetical protein HQM08_21795 [Candidatus Riflebacteria bacterium]|nr:hypothetical protein [Candidatus Riflebacteria bacterium]